MHKFDDIIPPSRRRKEEPLSQAKESSQTHTRQSRFPFATTIVVVIVVALSAASLMYFSSAKIEITPNTVSAAVQSSFTADQNADELPFQVITAQKIASQSVKSSGTKTVNSVASGTITIYNTQAQSQTLITKTRFATPAGLVYRIQAPVKIPGGSEAKPGSITAKVYADQEGSNYNIGPSSFTVPGFAGTPQASQVYARSTSAMTGGASGTVPTVDAMVGAQAHTALSTALAPDLAKSIQDQVPAGYVLLPGAATTTFQELEPVPSTTEGMVDLKEQGTITAVVFPNSALAKAIGTSVSGLGYQGEPIELSSTDTLSLVPSDGIPDASATTFTFTLSGTAPLVYSVDTARIATAVAGKTREAAQVALTNYPEVKRAIIVLRPFWKKSFPDDPASISITVNNQ